MKRALIQLPAAVAVLSALTACGGGGGDNAVTSAKTSSGVVVGSYFRHAKVCVDTNNNGKCDTGEPFAYTDDNGAYTVNGQGTVIAEIGTDATRYDPTTGTATPVTSALLFRAPSGVNVLSAISTELVALMSQNGGDLKAAATTLAARLGVSGEKLVEDHNKETDASIKALLQAETDRVLPLIANAVATGTDPIAALNTELSLDQIKTVVVIYAENRGFDNLYGLFPGANGIPGKNPTATGSIAKQLDFDGSELPTLPPVWGGLTASGQSVTVTQAQATGWANTMFQVDDPAGVQGTGTVISQSVITRDLVHRFYENQMQINGGKNDKYAAYTDAGALTMGYFDGSKMKMWNVAKNYVLADNFFQGAFGGSFLNHQYLICACAPTYPNADTAAAKPTISAVDTDANGNFVRLTPASTAASSVLSAAATYQADGNITPKDKNGMFYAVNTMQPPYQPSSNAPASTDTAKLYADPSKANTLPVQTQTNIGDLLTKKGVTWAWYAGAWNTTLAAAQGSRSFGSPTPNFQFHHHPFNYFQRFDPGTATGAAERAEHLRDFDSRFVADANAGTLPAVSFYKPQGNLNQHNGYANVTDGDQHIADLITTLQNSPQWKNMLIVVTYDENGGFYDHAQVPKADRWGPGTRIPAIIVSPFAKKGYVDHTQYDTASILRFLTNRYGLPELQGLKDRDTALIANGSKPMGDLSNALDFTQKQ
ncbi:acid phosphatase [Silvimonas iriomotensis]|uniref:Acid phosphatase n=1 Tax=Silvimonas iriomotensis TaxID=449662 RepID=A0ABQ2P4Y8_9NEIS|nr:acid phosphatase [Silvimonas iriomotensis]GGP18346.1 hypothetical protein GCM10010970_04470 [Silvimonas iriomotensis]